MTCGAAGTALAHHGLRGVGNHVVVGGLHAVGQGKLEVRIGAVSPIAMCESGQSNRG